MPLGLPRAFAWLLLLAGGVLLACAPAALASGPRYVTGPPYFTTEGRPIGWKQGTLLYSTDPGPLSASVSHSAADALVAAAANVWNVPVASITVARGAPLAEDVNGNNVYASASGVVFPDDVMSSNAAAVPIAILYDADGAITDTLLGSGASQPLSCRQNAVTESVDAFDPAGYILHAIIVVNGRCSGPAPAQQLQLRYQLERVFGRVLGLAWSQANDNVFTGQPAPTYQQQLHWPIMHPLDIICGAYTYQCLPQPFSLRPDDITGLVGVYPNPEGTTPPPGKQTSYANAFGFFTRYGFPTGEGMAGVNVVTQIQPGGSSTLEGYVTASSVTGYSFRRAAPSPFVAADPGPAGSMGYTDKNALAIALVPWISMDGLDYGGTLVVSTEAVNPLYTNAYSLGPYTVGTVAPAGSNLNAFLVPGLPTGGVEEQDVTVADGGSSCGNGDDGSLNAPVAAAPGGWWTGQLCGYGHAAYRSVSVRPGRTLTAEMTALDANGQATVTKARPVIGFFGPGDANNDLPSLAVAPAAFQALSLGTTALSASTGSLTSLRIGIADQRGDGRPDFVYQGRIFYADTMMPTLVAAAGAQAVITGTGFRAGNAVWVNGVSARATAWTQTSVTVTLPTMAQANATAGVPVDVTVSDLSTGATSTMTGALTYSGTALAPPVLRLVSSPAAPAYTGFAAALPFAVQAFAADGVTPLPGEPVAFTISNPSAGAGSPGSLSSCGPATPAVCTLLTDAHGIASTSVTPAVAGTVTLLAADARNTLASASVSLPVVTQAGSLVVLSAPAGRAYVTQPTSAFAVQVLSAATPGSPAAPLPGRSVTFTVTAGSAVFSTCHAETCTLTTDGNGVAQLTLLPSAAGLITVTAADGNRSATVNLTAYPWVDQLLLLSSPASGAVATRNAGTFAVRLVHGDGSTPDSNQTVTFSGPPGVQFSHCGTNICSQPTAGDGSAGQAVTASAAGTYVIQAAFGSVVVQATFTMLPNTPTLTVLSTPATTPVGTTAAAPFTVQLLDAFGSPVPGVTLDLNGSANDAVLSLCGGPACLPVTDGNGIVSTFVIPLRGGTIGLGAHNVQLGVQTNTSFLATGNFKTLTAIQQPGPAGVTVGVLQTLRFKLVGSDGTSPVGGDLISLVVQGGSFSFRQCEISYCRTQTGSDGTITVTGTAYATGQITIEAIDQADTDAQQVITFPAYAPGDVLVTVNAPANGSPASAAAALPFGIRVFAPDGVTPLSGRDVVLSVLSGSATFGSCGSATCVVTTDATGLAASQVSPGAPGYTLLYATEGGGSASAGFTAGPTAPAPAPDTLQLVGAPGGSSPVGLANATPFSVRVLGGDGVSPAPGRSIVFRLVAGSATFDACPPAPDGTCTLLTDAVGVASTPVTPLAAGAVTVSATELGLPANTLAASFNAVVQAPPAPPPPAPAPVPVPVQQQLTLVSGPGFSVFAGMIAPTPFAVRLTLSDGVTPVVGAAVTLGAGAGSTPALGTVQLGGCPALLCTLTTDAAGLVSATVTGGQPGGLQLFATTAGAGLPVVPVTVALQIVANQFSLLATVPASFVAEGFAASLTLTVAAGENGLPLAGQQVAWSAANPLVQLGLATSMTGNDGAASESAVYTPLAGGAQVDVAACSPLGKGSAGGGGASSTPCAGFTLTGVAAADLALTVATGGFQTTAGALAFAPVVLRVSEPGGHPVLGATVSIYQTVTAAPAPCPPLGRCPAAPVLAAEVTTAVTDLAGLVTVEPLVATPAQAAGQTLLLTHLAAAAGTQGFTTTVLTQQP